MKNVVLAAFLSLSFVTMITSAHATGSIRCVATNTNNVTVDILVGRLPVLGVLRATFTADDHIWSTNTKPSGEGMSAGSTRIIFGQGIDTSDGLRADFTDDTVSEILISLRTVRADGDKTSAEAGVLTINSVGVWPVVCDSD